MPGNQSLESLAGGARALPVCSLAGRFCRPGARRSARRRGGGGGATARLAGRDRVCGTAPACLAVAARKGLRGSEARPRRRPAGGQARSPTRRCGPGRPPAGSPCQSVFQRSFKIAGDAATRIRQISGWNLNFLKVEEDSEQPGDRPGQGLPAASLRPLQST